MGRVYLGRTASGRQVAVKVIRSGLVQDRGFRARFAREVDAARLVGGFHTASVVDADLESAPPWIATAYIPGPTLHQRVRAHGPITPPDLHTLVVGLAEGLQAVHASGLVHRDLKPGNVILSDDGPRIIDFGIARPLDAESLTTREAVFGTLPYMSPEQTDGSRVGPASDVFSLGTVLAFAATGANPFNGATMAETVHRLVGPPPDPGDADPLTRALITDCWNHDPSRRPAPAAIPHSAPTRRHPHRPRRHGELDRVQPRQRPDRHRRHRLRLSGRDLRIRCPLRLLLVLLPKPGVVEMNHGGLEAGHGSL
ncbi:serine/threonine-protein kinase [Streptomonospora mangrovi]|nr:serine/threonine-protein kinase [Streptomonospora mangrovi]